VRYKAWRSRKDSSLHLLCREGAEAFEALPSVVRNVNYCQLTRAASETS
jgi:hypothetical protein